MNRALCYIQIYKIYNYIFNCIFYMYLCILNIYIYIVCVYMYTCTSWPNSATCVSQARGKYSLPCRSHPSPSSECPWEFYGHECCPRMISATTEMNAATFGGEENCHLVACRKYFKGQENNTKPKQNAAFGWSYGKMGQVDGPYWDQDKWPNLVTNMDKTQC